MPGVRLRNIPRLGRSLREAGTTVQRHEPPRGIFRSRAHETGSILKVASRTRGLALVPIELIEIRPHDGSRVQAQEARITRNHALCVPAGRHRREIALLEKLDDLGANLDGISHLLDRETHLAAPVKQHVSELGWHQ